MKVRHFLTLRRFVPSMCCPNLTLLWSRQPTHCPTRIRPLSPLSKRGRQPKYLYCPLSMSRYFLLGLSRTTLTDFDCSSFSLARLQRSDPTLILPCLPLSWHP